MNNNLSIHSSCLAEQAHWEQNIYVVHVANAYTDNPSSKPPLWFIAHYIDTQTCSMQKYSLQVFQY